MNKQLAQPVPGPVATPPVYQNPFMAPNNYSEIHLNSFQTDTCTVKGPATKPNPSVQSALIMPPTGIAGTLAFNAAGQIITIRIAQALEASAPHAVSQVELQLIDPDSLRVLARLPLPASNTASPAGNATSQKHNVSFAGGYFYLDASENIVCCTATRLMVYQLVPSPAGPEPAWQFNQVKEVDLSGIMLPGDVLNSVLPDSAGNIWFITQGAVVGYLAKTNGQVFSLSLTVPGTNGVQDVISKSFASDADFGVYVVTNNALYRLQAGANGPTSLWCATYDTGKQQKPGQNQQGSGTTPTCFDDFAGNQFVAITDNASPLMHVNVYDRKTGRLIIQQAIFNEHPDASCCENSLIATGNSIVVENNYGNGHIYSTAGPLTTRPGVNRVDFDPATGKSWIAWANNEIAIPSVVSQLSTADGCIYTYAKDHHGWYWAALDFATGKLVTRSESVPWSNILGGVLANNYYSGLSIGPNGTAYVGVVGGIVAWRAN